VHGAAVLLERAREHRVLRRCPGVLEGILWAHYLVVLALCVQVQVRLCCGVAWAPCRGRLPERPCWRVRLQEQETDEAMHA